MKGDTLVVKDFFDMGNQPNSLYRALLLDTNNVPPERVYELQSGGLYPLRNLPATYPNRTTVIVGSDPTMVVNNRSPVSSPPLICNWDLGFSSTQGIGVLGDLVIKNCAIVCWSLNDGFQGMTFAGTVSPNLHLLFDNDVFEHARWVFVVIPTSLCDVTFRNCYFVNMNGLPSRQNGGVLDCFASLDTLLVENCTHIMAQGILYHLRSYPFKRVIFNHNTFVNCTGSVVMDLGYQSFTSLTNNIFINSSIQPYPRIESIDPGEQDLDWLPMGLVNVYPDSADVANGTLRKFFVHDNLAYWDPYLDDMNRILDSNHVNGVTRWQSQMIVANARTDSMFKHLGRYTANQYKYLTMDTWKNMMPTFTRPMNLFSTVSGDVLFNLKAFALATVDTGAVGRNAVLPDWRLVNVGADKRAYPDWPIPIDLSYSDADLHSAALGGFPLGYLNWFPTQKAAWLAQRDAEYANLNNPYAIPVGGIANAAPERLKLDQNYPNPFNPTTGIRYQVPGFSKVRLTVYDVLGRQLAILVDEKKAPGAYEVKFDGSSLSSGIYLYRLETGGHAIVKKMALIK